MKLSFTTLGCPDWNFEKILDEAQRMGYQGIEIRGVDGKMRAEEIVQFFPENAAETQKKLKEHGLVITNFGASCRFDDKDKIPDAIEEGKAAIDVCRRMGIPAIRVFGDQIPEGAEEAQIVRQVIDGISVLCDYAKDKNVEVWIETHGNFNTLERIAAVVEGVNRKNFGILWDIEHTDKIYGTDFMKFYGPMKPHIRHLHTKDHVREDGKFVLVVPGKGEIPIVEIVNKLNADGYEGFYSLEWEKKWHPHLPEPEIAFPVNLELMKKANPRRLRVAIIGYGRSGRDIHTNLLTQLPGLYEIAAYAEGDAERRAMIEKEVGVPVYNSYKDLIKIKDKFDFAVNASFSHEHAAISKELMAEGINVLSEKPAAKDLDEFNTVLKQQAFSGVRYNVFQQYRFSPAFNKLREIINSGALGRIVQINLFYDGFARRWDWQTVHNFTAGSLLNTGPHPVDHALALMGFPQDLDVKCFMDCAHTFGNAEDYVKLLLHAKNAPVLDIEISSCNGFADYIYLVQGTRGSLKGNDKKLEWKFYSEDNAPEQKLILEPLKGANGEPLYCREKLSMQKEVWEAGDETYNDTNVKGLAYYRALHKTYTQNADFPVTNEQIALQMKVIQEAHAQNKELFS